VKYLSIWHKVLITEEYTLKARNILLVSLGRNFVFQEKALCEKDKNGEKKAKDEVVKQLNVLQLNVLRKERFQDTGSSLPDVLTSDIKIYKLFEKVGLDKIKYEVIQRE
jgi:hypothetical protein